MENGQDRDKRGRFTKGNTEGRKNNGRRRRKPWDMLLQAATADAWPAILKKAVMMAKAGDILAMRFLADHQWGKAPMRVEHTGAEGGPISVAGMALALAEARKTLAEVDDDDGDAA